MSTEAADALAARAEAVAEHVEGGDGCAATDEIGALRGDIDELRGEALPEPLAEELLAAVADLEGQVSCDPAPPPEEDEAEEQPDDDEGGGPPDDRGPDDDDDDDKPGGNERKNEKKKKDD